MHYDENRVTGTTSKSRLSELLEKVSAAGITTVEMNLWGRFHSECHRDWLEPLARLCDSTPAFQLPCASEMLLPCRTDVTDTGEHITTGNLSLIALEAVLVKPSKWWRTYRSFCGPDEEAATIITFGSERCTPPSLVRNLSPSFQLVHYADIADQASNPAGQSSTGSQRDIAVIGMACKVAGADDLDEFWTVLREGQSQHTEVPETRFGFESAFRDLDTEKKWYGNFIKDYDTFDHRFFKKSPREASAMDPQQRVLLEVAYQAVEQSGYFQTPNPPRDVGCYIGTCAVDYESNVACHAPNAFSSTGTLRGFIAGKISHYFGWEGPGLTVDTACSGSAVAVHQACKAILSGECETALAGGVNIMTQPLAYQNLAAASFLSPSGQCKPFCMHADGYCRGEGVAAVYLKRKSAAVEDGDQIFGIISGTAVLQNQNCTPIFVPNALSLSHLFRKVLAQAQLEPHQISFVEAHGTGTPVGDPAEYDSISQVFAVAKRPRALQLGSVKGSVGHTESTSGLVSLVKVLLMMHESAFPPQASFSRMSPHIKARDSVEISTSLRPWDDSFKAALINNYGASGSNASMIITQPSSRHAPEHQQARDTKFPFWFSALDDKSLHAYVRRLRRFLESKAHDVNHISIQNLSFNVSRQSNRHLNRALLLSCSTVEELQETLSGDLMPIDRPPARPVILCFGGQVSTFVGLDRHIFDNATILRFHLDQCDSVSQALGHGSIYPGIFQRTPIEDTVSLQLALFSLQYASARSWIDCGIQPSALVGHSFGELTALCISGALDLRDTIKMIADRARIIRDEWGPEKGAMVAVEADLHEVERLLIRSTTSGVQAATIACFNGPRSFTLAGSTRAIDAVTQAISSDVEFSSIRAKKLNVTNAFHSTLVESLLPSLEHMARDLKFNPPKIAVEFATEAEYRETLNSSFVAGHMRNPVYFDHAIQRLSQKYPTGLWLEAGSNSTVTTMASRALGVEISSGGDSAFQFQAVNITSKNATTQLTSATLGLWNAGLSVTFWPHNSSQTHQYAAVLLPPYQFEKSRHWMELKSPSAQTQAVGVERHQSLWVFERYQDAKKHTARFRIVTEANQYKEMVSNHRIAQTAPICPATLEVDITIEALMSLHREFRAPNVQPQILSVDNHAPICLDSSRVVWLDFTAMDTRSNPCRDWSWKIISESKEKVSNATLHVTGQIAFRSADDPQSQREFARYERLVSHQRCLNVLDGSDPDDDIVQGRNIYRIFDEIVQYGEQYQGLQRLVGSRSRSESAGRVVKKYTGESWLDAHMADCFSQVGGIWVNCMTDRPPGDMYIANGFEKWVHSPNLRVADARSDVWDVLACHNRHGENAFVTDIFIFDSRRGTLTEVILGIKFAKVSKLSMSKLLSRLTVDLQTRTLTDPAQEMLAPSAPPMANGHNLANGIQQKKIYNPQTTITPRVQLILADLSGLDSSEIKDDAELVELGVDSLMAMELAREVTDAFDCILPLDALIEITTVRGLVQWVELALGLEGGDSSADDTTGSITGSSDDTMAQLTAQTSVMQSSSASVVSINGMGKALAQQTTNDVKGLASHPAPECTLEVPFSVALEAFSESKALTDHFIDEHQCDGYLAAVMPMQTQLCIALTLEAFKQLGCDLGTAMPGQKIGRICHVPSLNRLVDYLYEMVEQEGRLISRTGTEITRTTVPAPTVSSTDILQTLLRDFPEHFYPHKLTHFAGSRLAEVLSGKVDGVKVIFGSDEGRELVSGLYADSPLNKLSYTQMQDFVKRLTSRLSAGGGPLKILELGAGTGGTTKYIVPLLANLGIRVEYTFSDLSPSFVAAARKRFGKEYPFMQFRAVDMEEAPPEDLLNSQHMILASNAVHATHSLTKSLGNMRKALRSDGFVMMLEMTRTLYWVDMIFGLLEGWWLFDDGRRHAIAHQSRWKKDLYAVGYRHVDWTDGNHPETNIQRLFFAVNGNEDRSLLTAESEIRQAMVDSYIEKYTRGFAAPSSLPASVYPHKLCVLVTGATGSLGSHIVAHFAQLDQVEAIVCLNRKGNMDPWLRQVHALESRGITTSVTDLSKLEVIETDSAKPMLGLGNDQYATLAAKVTYIIHNAWPMSSTRPLKGFEAQFMVMRNLLDFASTVTSTRGSMVSFQFVSSIAVVGHYPNYMGSAIVPEERMATVDAVLPNGYGDAKWVCERMLDETLHRHPHHFRAMVVRPGQIAGSKTSGYWNHMEHFSFLVKSSQTLRAFPRFDGLLSWIPVSDVAAAMSDLLLQDETAPHLVYHIDNPVRQPWSEMVQVLANAIQADVVPFEEWVRRVRSYPGPVEWENPAMKLIAFFEHDYTRMSCGGLLLDTALACEHSKTLRAVGPVGADVARKYVQAWKDIGFLNP